MGSSFYRLTMPALRTGADRTGMGKIKDTATPPWLGVTAKTPGDPLYIRDKGLNLRPFHK